MFDIFVCFRVNVSMKYSFLLNGFLVTSRQVVRHSSSKAVRVRFAPSPTGDLHLGSLRTALYNYVFAKHHDGAFILRIEDTDQARLVPTSTDQIHRVLDHYGLRVDEGPRTSITSPYGPYVQSQRIELYKEKVEQLISCGHAYRCFCSEDRLALLRKDALRTNSIPKYDRKCRSIAADESVKRAQSGESYVVRFKLDKQDISFKVSTSCFVAIVFINSYNFFSDEVFGSVTQCLDESDVVLLKSDGFPTYHLANVVDDKAMEISHVIRGMEWLSSTGKHVALYKAFGWKTPQWVHLSLITRDGKKKLSKRDKDAFVDYYDKELGALPEAVLNLLIRNGSGIKNFDSAKLYSLSEMISNFDLSSMGRRNLQLDHDCLAASSRLAFQAAKTDDLVVLLEERIKSDCPDIAIPDKKHLEKVVSFLRINEEKFAFLSSLTKGEFKWMLITPSSSEKVLSKFDINEARRLLQSTSTSEDFSTESLKKVAASLNTPYARLLMAIRISLIDSSSGPPIGELNDFFGERECRQRLNQMLSFLG